MEHRELFPSLNLHIQQPRYKSKWVPLAGRKRKAPDEPNGARYDDPEPPQKLSAVDDEVAPFIIKDGYIVDDSDASNDGHPVTIHPDKLVQLEDVEMDDDASIDDPSDNFFTGENTCFSGKDIGDGGFEHAMDGLGIPTKLSKGNVQLGSVVLSEEIRASLAKKPNDVSDLIPPSIVDQMYKNATAVVLWHPPQNPLNLSTDPLKTYPVSSSKKTDEKKQIDEDEIEVENIESSEDVTEKNEMEVEILL